MRVSRMPGQDSFMAVTTAIVTVAVLIAALTPGGKPAITRPRD